MANVELTDRIGLAIGKVNTIKGVTATTLALNDAAGVKQAQPITAENVLLEGTGGVFSLINPANSIDKLAANTKTLKLADSSSLEIGTVRGVSGVTATTVSLSDPTIVTQSEAITARNLLLEGAGGTFTLTNGANDIGILVADAATIDLTNTGALSIGQVFGAGGVDAATFTLSDKGKVTRGRR